MRKLTLFVAALLMAVVVSAQENQPKQIKLTEEEQQMVQSNNDFAFRLFRQARTNDSQILSPLSITVDLGMLNNGADGITREEINAVLAGSDVSSADVINSFCRKLLNETATLDEKTRVAIANNIYVNTRMDCQLLPAFTEMANQYYDATPESRDFSDGKTRDVMNQWGSDHTEGMTKEAIKEEEFNEDAMSYLLNALYFKGEWTHKFDATQTQRHQFDEGKKEVQMMHQQSEFSYAKNNVYQSIVLPYGNMAYQMTVFLPCYGYTISDVLNELNGKNWQQAGYDTYNVNLKLPKFETSTDMRLEDVMKALGMPNAFEGGYCFNQFCNENVIIGMMKQVAKIKLDEEGTEAAAVTIIGEATTGMPRTAEFHATRPFLYIISEQSTGAIFFIGQYLGDGTTSVGDAPRLMNYEGVNSEKLYDLQGRRLMQQLRKGVYIRDGRKVVVK
jgi:serpin B